MSGLPPDEPTGAPQRLRAATSADPVIGVGGTVLPTGPAKTAAVRSMFDAIAPRYDVVNRLMTFGLDVGWRRRTVSALALPAGSRILDLACGTGDFQRLLAARGLRTVGMDLSRGMLTANRVGTPVVQADGAALPLGDGSLDGVTCGYALRNFADLPAVLAELGRVVRPGGRIALLEVAEPPSPVLELGHRIWFRHVVPVLGGLLSDRDAYRYLPESTAYLPSADGIRSLLGDAGFSTVNHHLLSGGLSQIFTATRSGTVS